MSSGLRVRCRVVQGQLVALDQLAAWRLKVVIGIADEAKSLVETSRGVHALRGVKAERRRTGRACASHTLEHEYAGHAAAADGRIHRDQPNFGPRGGGIKAGVLGRSGVVQRDTADDATVELRDDARDAGVVGEGALECFL